MKSGLQTTLNDQVSLQGIGVHSGKPVSVTLHPADPDSGIVFLRTGLDGVRERAIDAQADALDAFYIDGIRHNVPFLAALMAHPRWRSGKPSTSRSAAPPLHRAN